MDGFDSAKTKKSRYESATYEFCMAVREGFEPSVRCRTAAFQATSFDHSDT